MVILKGGSKEFANMFQKLVSTTQSIKTPMSSMMTGSWNLRSSSSLSSHRLSWSIL